MIKMKLHLLLAEHQMTQQEFSYATKIRQNTISNYCNNSYKHIVAEHLNLICKYFHCQISDLIEYIEEQN
jgi:putative transcriptional regulator